VLAVFPPLGMVVEVGNILLLTAISRMGERLDGDEEAVSLNST
jgi:hypothetical protein